MDFIVFLNTLAFVFLSKRIDKKNHKAYNLANICLLVNSLTLLYLGVTGLLKDFHSIFNFIK